MLLRIAFFSVFCMASSAGAHAVGWLTKLNCASDYYAYCSAHPVGTPGVSKCMRANGHKLSKACINALISDGEITREEVAQEQKRILAGRRAKYLKVAEAKTRPAKSKASAARTKSETRVATALDKPEVKSEAKTARAALAAASWKTTVMRIASLSLDQETYLAFKNRGTQFVEGADITVAVPDVTPPRPVPARRAPKSLEPVTTVIVKRVEPAAPSEYRVAAEQPQFEPQQVAYSGELNSPRAFADLPGRMSLGSHLSSSNGDEQPLSWWQKLVRFFKGGNSS